MIVRTHTVTAFSTPAADAAAPAVSTAHAPEPVAPLVTAHATAPATPRATCAQPQRPHYNSVTAQERADAFAAAARKVQQRATPAAVAVADAMSELAPSRRLGQLTPYDFDCAVESSWDPADKVCIKHAKQLFLHVAGFYAMRRSCPEFMQRHFGDAAIFAAEKEWDE